MMEVERNKPRVALLGEFSAGKSTFANLLLGRTQSPVRVTATQMPPIWYVFGTGEPVLLTEEDSEVPMPDGPQGPVPVEGTKALRVPLDAPALQQFELLDMPGSSDPNMSSDIWDGMLPNADVVIWCTPATQAWRQSEAAIWDAMPARLHERSLLLLTRFDKVGASDRARVLKRVRRETANQFRAVLPAALLGVKGDPRHCKVSGLAQVMEALDDLLINPTRSVPEPETHAEGDTPDATLDVPKIAPRRVSALSVGTARVTRRRHGDQSASI